MYHDIQYFLCIDSFICAGVGYKPQKNTDGTPSESISDVLVRANQLISTVESMYSGENVVVISPDSEVISVLTAALYDSDPDKALPLHAKFNYNNGEYIKLSPYVMTTDKRVRLSSNTCVVTYSLT